MSFEQTSSKIKSRDELVKLCADLRAQGARIVTSNGCFDLIHVGHVHSLEGARMFGDMLVVGINSDASVKRLKGEGRPILPESERLRLVAALECVSYVTLFDEDDPVEFIKCVRPHVHCKGADYAGGKKKIVEQSYVESWGGRMEFVDILSGHSTTSTIAEVLSRD